MDIIIQFILLILGFAILAICAEIFVDGARNIAYNFKIPAAIVGLTIVAFGTSAPEVSMSLFYVSTSHYDTVITNVLGSNIFNILVVIGVSALISSLTVDKDLIKRDFPFLIISTIGLLIIACYYKKLIQIWGIIFLILIFAYIIYLVIKTKEDKKAMSEEIEDKFTIQKSILYTLVGLIGIAIGSQLAGGSTEFIADYYKLSGGIIGLTIVAIGTSLPELITSISALRKGEKGMVIGNVLGSSIFNILFILGLSSIILPLPNNFLPINIKFLPHIFFMTIITIVGAAFAYTQNEVDRKEGILLILLYIAYLAFTRVYPI